MISHEDAESRPARELVAMDPHLREDAAHRCPEGNVISWEIVSVSLAVRRRCCPRLPHNVLRRS
eukprot:12729064-Heterocapsa_arctica.AAC.1